MPCLGWRGDESEHDMFGCVLLVAKQTCVWACGMGKWREGCWAENVWASLVCTLDRMVPIHVHGPRSVKC